MDPPCNVVTVCALWSLPGPCGCGEDVSYMDYCLRVITHTEVVDEKKDSVWVYTYVCFIKQNRNFCLIWTRHYSTVEEHE